MTHAKLAIKTFCIWQQWLLLLLLAALPLAYLPLAHIGKRTIFQPPASIEIGDFIYRMGSDADSELIAHLSGFDFSHIGMVVQTQPIRIIHATTDDDANKANQVISSSFAEFTQKAKGYAITRAHFLTQAEKTTLAHALEQRLGEAFVLLAKGEKNLYCTTLLEREIQKLRPFSPSYQHIDVPVFRGKYLFPKSFFHYPDMKIIATSKEHELQ